MKSKVDDYVYVHIAGHGLLDDDLNWYFATQNIDFFDPSVNGLKYEDIEGLLDGIPARNKMLLMDACHSGEVDKQDGVEIADKADGDDTRGAVTVNKRKKKVVTDRRLFYVIQFGYPRWRVYIHKPLCGKKTPIFQ